MLPRLIRYNLKVIFAGKFVWFLLAALLFFLFFLVYDAYRGIELSESVVYNDLFFPAILLIFYPSVFGIQNDEDNRILEILFGIPNYRYKVWLLRLVIIYIAIGLVLVVFGYMANYLLYPVNPWELVFRLMFPLIFIGNMSFMMSTVTRSGNGTAVVMIILGIVIILIERTGILEMTTSFWNILLDPFSIPSNVHPVVWDNTLLKNMIFLAIGGIVWLLIGLLNLQKREKFV